MTLIRSYCYNKFWYFSSKLLIKIFYGFNMPIVNKGNYQILLSEISSKIATPYYNSLILKNIL